MLVMPQLPESPARAGARRLVENIAQEHGYLSEDDLSQLPDDVRRKVNEAMLKKDEIIGSSVITLAKNLYNSRARFVFELLQNADDNHYTKARANGDVPFLSFQVYPRRIVLECNEDGFTKENLVAICDVGKSSKTGAQGYIGEKGIGFKSVFMVAWKAYIQSGDFSFSFQHKNGDSGMGMISPIWESGERLAGPLTRITLFLHETGDNDVLSGQFRELQDTILLFMKNIKRIDITMYDESDLITSRISFSMEEANDRVSLTKRIVQNGQVQEHMGYYHITKHTAEHLAKNENRKYSEAEEATRAYAKAEIILAFPLAHNSLPIIEPQDVFAFLPIRHMGFKFLIQTDFVTQATRQDIVMSSARNVGLVREIAFAFVKAVLQFCKHSTLQYRWMRYLPQKNEYPWDPFWVRLIDGIHSALGSKRILRPRSHGDLRCIEDMRRLSGSMVDKNGGPLFDDVDPEQYLASEYLPEDLNRLTEYGLGYMSMGDFITRVQRDLDRSSGSRMKSSMTDEDWHSRTAKALGLPFRKEWFELRRKVEGLSLLPLESGEWVSTSGRSIYYPHINGVSVPKDLDLNLIDTRASKNIERRQLFDYLKAQTPSPRLVRDRIMAKYNRLEKPNIDLITSRNHLTFLYLTAHLDEPYFHTENLWIFNHCDDLQKPAVHNFYIADDQPYGARELFRPIESEAPGFKVSFVHPKYMENVPETPEGQNLPWNTWFNESLFILELMRLTEMQGKRLSEECLYIAKYRPEKFLGFLSRNWTVDGSVIIKRPNLLRKLLQTEVLCRGNRKHLLGETYLPTAELQQLSLSFLEEGEFFPWLKLEVPLWGNRPPEWETLMKALGIGYPKSDLDFYLAILRFILDANPSAVSSTRALKLYNLYECIQASLAKYSDDRTSHFDTIRAFFEFRPSIFVPATEEQNFVWAKPSQCLWEALPDMESRYPLKSLYESYFNSKGNRKACLTEFFKQTLSIPDVSTENFLEELKTLSLKSTRCTKHINRIYESLNKMRPTTGTAVEKLKNAFKDKALVYVADGSWIKVSQCIWSTATEIDGMTALNNRYSTLKDFFVDFLGVQTLTLKMVFDKLKGQGAGQSSVGEIKKTIRTLNSFLESETKPPNPKPILESRIFPVRNPNGGIELCTSEAAFAIVDRKHLHNIFSKEAKFLDFGLNEILELEPFLKWAGLEDRYLSCSVKEISTLCSDSNRQISNLHRDISRKSHGLLRIAVHFKSPRVQNNQHAFYKILKSAETRETDGICSELRLEQGGKDIKVEKERSELHIEGNESKLKVYVPLDKRSQERCFLNGLPKALLEWIMTDSSTQNCGKLGDKALNLMLRVLLTPNNDVSELLDEEGIASVEMPDDCDSEQPLDPPLAVVTPATPTLANRNIAALSTLNRIDGNSEAPAWDTVDAPRAPTTPASISHSISVPVTPDDIHSDNEAPVLDTPASSLSSPPVSRFDVGNVTFAYRRTRQSPSNPALRPNDPLFATPPRAGPVTRALPSHSLDYTDQLTDPQYRSLLDKVITAARKTRFPSQGAFDMSALRASLAGILCYGRVEEPFRLHSISRLERDKMIGAAGELFVFETLSHLRPGLPGFSRGNWQSTIRKYVTVHHEYSNMEPWNGRETTDITYDDRDGRLTSLFIENEYLDSEVWAGRRPKYFIEVKSTTGPCDTPFFMSKNQYQMMQTMSNGESGREHPDCIYVVFRIFNLGQEFIDMRVYVDPDVMRARRELSFTAESWSVAPGISLNR